VPEAPEAPVAPAVAVPAAAAPAPAAEGAVLQSLTQLRGASELESAGAAALQAGDYVQAINHFGAALRRLRAGNDGAGADAR
jgi:hypothetical protein